MLVDERGKLRYDIHVFEHLAPLRGIPRNPAYAEARIMSVGDLGGRLSWSSAGWRCGFSA